MGKKRDTQDILDLTKELEDYYGNFLKQCRDEDVFYNLDFHVKKVKGYDTHRPATARLAIDDAAAQIDTQNLAITVRPRNNSPKEYERAVRLRQFYIGFWHRVHKTQGMVLAHCARHFMLYGVAYLKTVYDLELWADRPTQEKSESIEHYVERLAKWREERSLDFPIVVMTPNPQNILPDPSIGGSNYYIEKGKRRMGQVANRFPDWPHNPKHLDKEVDWIEYWDNEYVAYVADNKEVMPCMRHNYGRIPYITMDAAMGYMSSDSSPEERFRGLLHPIHDDLQQEARLTTMMEAVTRSSAYRSWLLFGREDQQAGLDNVRQSLKNQPGEVAIVPVENARAESTPIATLPNEVFNLYMDCKARIQAATVMPIVKGEIPTGPASGYKTAVLAGLARQKYDRVLYCLGNMAEDVNSMAAMLIEKVIQDPITVWATAYPESIDVTVSPSDINGYYQSEVKLKSVAPEEEERMGMLGMRFHQGGLISRRLWATKYGGIENPIDDARQMMIEQILASPEVQSYMTQIFMRAQQMQQQIEQITEQPGGLGNQGIPPPVTPRPNEPQRYTGDLASRQEMPGSLERMNLVASQLGREAPGGPRVYPWGQR